MPCDCIKRWLSLSNATFLELQQSITGFGCSADASPLAVSTLLSARYPLLADNVMRLDIGHKLCLGVFLQRPNSVGHLAQPAKLVLGPILLEIESYWHSSARKVRSRYN
jgi:hypothetical protein